MFRPRRLMLAPWLCAMAVALVGCGGREQPGTPQDGGTATGSASTSQQQAAVDQPAAGQPATESSPATTPKEMPEEPGSEPATPPASPLMSPMPPASDNGTPAKPDKTEPPAQSQQPAASTASADAASDGKKKPIDPVEANGPIFEGWPKPRLALVITGEQNGYMEPCGCAGLENMKGGLKRRGTLLASLREQGWPVVAVDLGGMVRRFGKQAEIKFTSTIDALRTMQYDAIGLGPHDLQLPVDVLLSNTGNPENTLTAANVGLLGFDTGLPSRYRVVKAGGVQVGIIAVLGEKFRQGVNNAEIVFKPAAEAIAEVLPEVREQAQLLILLSHGTVEESTALAKQFPQFDVVATAGGASLPPAEPGKIEGSSTWLIEVGQKGMYAGVVGYYGDDLKTRRFQRVPIDARFKDAPNIYQQQLAYQDQLKQLGLTGLGLNAVPHPSGRQFVGSEKCGECHTKAFDVWKNTSHAHAMETLAKLDPPRQFDPECISCHATGWEPQRYFPFESGFIDLKSTPHLAGNGCENCHGPGSQHVAAEEGTLEVTEDQRLKLRELMRLSLEKADDNCRQCHDLDNSPDYVKHGFEAYWPLVEHKGKD